MKILCDTREQAPYTFDRYQGVTVERAALQTGFTALPGCMTISALSANHWTI